MNEGIVRPLALCIVKRNNKILVTDGYDSKKKQTFYRLLGGGIEFGEPGKDALKREFMEELGATLKNINFLTVLENIFEFGEKKGHEIILVFEAELGSEELAKKEFVDILDSESGKKASWQNISDFKEQKSILYPEGLLKYLN